jgi:uncharacterized SAM-binding protein YcdF (DUF218 family)
MNLLIKAFVFFLPTAIILAIGQTKFHARAVCSVLFVLFSLVLMNLPRLRAKQSEKLSTKHYTQGLLFAAFFLVCASRFPIGGFLAQPLLLEHSQQNADAIVVLASGATLAGDPALSGYQRNLHGIRLLRNNRAPLLFISTGFSDAYGFAEASWVASLTAMIDAPKQSIRILKSKEITTSKTEADYIAQKLKQVNARRILLVTGGYHIYRAAMVYKKLGFEVLPAPCHSSKGLYYSMGHYLRALDATVHEWVGLVYYKLRNFI